jgi:Na+/proline symporter
MTAFFGLNPIDLWVIAGYFAVVVAIGFWASAKVKNDEDYFLGGRRFGKGLLVMHWLCTGTHSEMAVQVAGATARVGLGGIWYQWMWLFSTPFYWVIAPMIRRLRVVTTGDFFRLRYGRSLEMLYAMVALAYLVLSMAMLLRGASAAIAGATGGAVPTEKCVVLLSVLFSTYVMAGGLVAAAYTDFLQGAMIIVLSVLLVPAGFAHIGGVGSLTRHLGAEMLAVTAPPGANEGDPWFVVAMSLLGLVGIVAQPHVMTANGSGKSETEARVGMCYGNFIKRLLTVAWALSGLIALVMFADELRGLDPAGDQSKQVSETFFGRAIQQLLGDGWRGLMIACLVAGVTSAETFMVVGAGLFTRNVLPFAQGVAASRKALWAGRFASAGMLCTSILVALLAGSVTQLVLWSVQVIGLMGPAVWLGVTWRRSNAPAAWASVLTGLAVWGMVSLDSQQAANVPQFAGITVALAELGKPAQILLTLAAQFVAFTAVALATPPRPARQLDPFFARLLTPVGAEQPMAREPPQGAPPDHDELTLGLHGVLLDYGAVAHLGIKSLRRLGIEIPRWSRVDWAGFLAAWILVGGLVTLLVGMGRIGL